MIIVALFLALLIAVLTLFFALQNSQGVTIRFLLWEWPDISLSLALIIPFALGVVVGYLVTVPSAIKNGLIIFTQKRKIDSLEKSLANQSADYEKGLASKTSEMEKAMAAKASAMERAAAPTPAMEVPGSDKATLSSSDPDKS